MGYIICPECNDGIKANNRWDFIDGEKHNITCSCGHHFTVFIERPIKYYVIEKVQSTKGERGRSLR